ncbi:hypothetical protein SAMN04487911_12161 [Arenibacter nanhaiticus]|uniref:Uncharacterized protein n=1 Tax=Arenibacter nanhaiticus TaxID=558155 RepID=A0A1M6JDF5_9FLAO|nr:hypothetical protein SAMN04487911_12161 [Arenibacter nanhaiticus]
MVELDVFVRMLNHEHIIIIINETENGIDRGYAKKSDIRSFVETPNLGVSTKESVDQVNSNNSTINPISINMVPCRGYDCCELNPIKY